jgi:xanthine dehydrogenase molybdopterin-binding subunit B
LAKVRTIIKRLGGGFGGKGQGRLDTAVALCAVKQGRPVKMLTDRAVDLVVTGMEGLIWKFPISYSFLFFYL